LVESLEDLLDHSLYTIVAAVVAANLILLC
jgi:hypothetical protein